MSTNAEFAFHERNKCKSMTAYKSCCTRNKNMSIVETQQKINHAKEQLCSAKSGQKWEIESTAFANG